MDDMAFRNDLVLKAQTLCREHDARLLYLTLFGSRLYGTARPGASDTDVRGVFAPSRASLALGRAKNAIHWSTGESSRRNAAHDVDIDLWSVQHWLLKLLACGDTGAMDVLFSPTHPACVLHRDPALDAVFDNPLRLLDTVNGRACAEYSLGQARKYGVKGSRVGALKAVFGWINDHGPYGTDERLKDHIDALAAVCADGDHCALVALRDEPALQLCGKLHAASTRMTEFARRIAADMERYGARAMDAEKNKGVDFKGLSHAMRAIMEMEELFATGRIVFPLKDRAELLAIKDGAWSWRDLETSLLDRLKTLDQTQRDAAYKGRHDADFAERRILSCYGLTSQSVSTTAVPAAPEGFGSPMATVAEIQKRLDEAEARFGVKVLYAVESGSRGWGFASEDSDYDVRFLYVHPPDWYLRVAPEKDRDVIELGVEQTPVGELDINGWELRKALKLFRDGNPPLLEWLSSPLVYRETGPLAETLRAEADAIVAPQRLWRHYCALMRNSLKRFESDRPTIKVFFYVLRPLLAMRYVELTKKRAPMRFDLLMDAVVTDSGLRRTLDALVARKKSGAESDRFAPPEPVAAFLKQEIDRIETAPPDWPQPGKQARVDWIFQTALFAAFPAPNAASETGCAASSPGESKSRGLTAAQDRVR